MASAAVALASSPVAGAAQFTIESQGKLTDAQVTALERAVSFQVDHQVAKFYPGAQVTFGPNGIPVWISSLESILGPQACGDLSGTVGCHGPGEVLVGETSLRETEVTFDHEVIETTLDPEEANLSLEICDAVSDKEYRGVGGVWLSDFLIRPGGSKDFLSLKHLRRHRRR